MSEDSKWRGHKHIVLAEAKQIRSSKPLMLVRAFEVLFFVTQNLIKRRNKVSANLEVKKEVVSEIKDKLSKSKLVVFVDYRGLTVAEDTEMRSAFRKNNNDYKVYKNRLVLRALNELGISGLEDKLQGTSAVAFGYEDEISAAKTVADFKSKTNKLEIKCGILNGQLISSDEVNTLAKIPSREELIGKLLFIFQNPMRSLAVAINEIAKKQA